MRWRTAHNHRKAQPVRARRRTIRKKFKHSADKSLRELKKPAIKRTMGQHGDFQGFLLLVERVLAVYPYADLFDIELPQEIKCSTCKFLVPEFNEKMPCWVCVEDEDLPKWRPKNGR